MLLDSLIFGKFGSFRAVDFLINCVFLEMSFSSDDANACDILTMFVIFKIIILLLQVKSKQ